MWGESSKTCEEANCQCSGLITENFKINSGNSATKRKQETALSYNYKSQMNPHTLDFTSPIQSPRQSKRRILGELQNFKPSSPIIERLKNSPLDVKSPLKKVPFSLSNMQSPLSVKSPLNSQSPRYTMQSQLHSVQSPLHKIQTPKLHNVQSPLNQSHKQSPLHKNSPPSSINSPIIASHSPLTSRLKQRTKLSRMFEERTKFKSSHSNKENMSLNSLESETYMNLNLEEETRDCNFGNRFEASRRLGYGAPKLDFTDTLPSKSCTVPQDIYVPEKEQDLDDLESLQDLEAEFDNENFEQCTYEIISTDSPDIISQGRGTSRKICARNFNFGAPIADSEQSTSFNHTTTRMLNFDDDNFEFTSPAVKKPVSVKKSLKFDETPTKTFLRRDRSDSSIGSMSSSPSSSTSRLNRVFTSESTTSMESGFVSEFEEPFLEIEDSNSPKIANFNDLLSGKIKDNPIIDNFLKRPTLGRSLSLHPESKARVSLLSILESPGKRSQKRTERQEDEEKNSKRRRSNIDSPVEKPRPVLQRAFSENNASIMSALARSTIEPDLIGDFTQPFSLPLTTGDHTDLKSISCDTLAALIRGEFEDTVPEFQVIDCRYPYEFTGGHIEGAINLYTGAQVADELGRGKQRVLVFHCEFSLQRGPQLSRYLRSADREKNKENYPNLDYPEVYLLHEGYRSFYNKYPELCTPRGYTAMLDPRHRHLLRKHRSISEPTKTMRRNRLLL